jgi:cold shock CspA family protein
LEVVVLVGEPRLFVLPVSDPDGDELTYSVVEHPTLGSITGELPDFTFASSGGGRDEFTYRVDDGEFEVEGTVSIEIRLSNDPPTANTDEYQGDERITVPAPGVLGNDTDPDGEQLTARLVGPPEHGEVTVESDGSFVYLPESGYAGSDKFTYAAVDALGEESIATVAITVGEVAVAEVPSEAATVDPSQAAVVAASVPAWTPPASADQALMGKVLDSVATLFIGMMTTIAGVRLPLLLLSVALALALAFGRASLWQIDVRGEGTVQVFDSGAGLGRLVADGDGDDVFIPRRAVGSRTPRAGQRVEFVAATIRGKRVALRVWSAT